MKLKRQQQKKYLEKEPKFLFQAKRMVVYINTAYVLLTVSNNFYFNITIHWKVTNLHTRLEKQIFLKETDIHGIDSTEIIRIRKIYHIVVKETSASCKLVPKFFSLFGCWTFQAGFLLSG